MSGWQVGDLALCVDDRDNLPVGRSPLKKGAVYRVIGVTSGSNIFYGPGAGLLLDSAVSPCSNGFAANRFRKIKPDEHEACEPEFVVLLNRTKRTVEAADPHPAGQAASRLWLTRFDQLSLEDK